jgi:hypothetical protein
VVLILGEGILRRRTIVGYFVDRESQAVVVI